MELWWTAVAQRQLPQTIREQAPVHMGQLPAWKQLIMESRQVQTVSQHLMTESKRQRDALSQQVNELRQHRWVLFDRESSLLT